MTQVKIDEVLCLICAKISAKFQPMNTMPGRIVFLVKFLLDLGSNVLLYVVLLRGLVAQSTASCCMSSDMSAFLITACQSDIVTLLRGPQGPWEAACGQEWHSLAPASRAECLPLLSALSATPDI